MMNFEAGMHVHQHDAERNEADVEVKQLRNGNCRRCGIRTHEAKRVGRILKRLELRPLTNEHLLSGRCLLCHPLPPSAHRVDVAAPLPPPAPVAVDPRAGDACHRPPKTDISSSAPPEPAKESHSFVRDAKRLPGGSYEGQLASDGGREGHGTMRYDNGDVYVGCWKDDRKEGQGRYSYADGSEFDGHWKRGKKEGHGTLRYSRGDCYVGQWKDDVRDGHGTYKYGNGGEYVGPWKADKKHGRGATRYANGEEYRGEYVANKKHGRATYLFADGMFHISRYGDGSPIGEGAQLTSDCQVAWRLRDGKLAGTIPLQEAIQISARIGIPLPDTDSPSPLPDINQSSACSQPQPCPQSLPETRAVPTKSTEPKPVGSQERRPFRSGRPGFIDYLADGGEVGLCVAIDFTAANGDPRRFGTPHHNDPEGFYDNDYEEAIRAVQSVPSVYCPIWSAVPVWGFGAKFDGGEVRQAFQCGPEKEVPLQGILQAYRSVFKRPMTMSGPADFTGVIQAATKVATERFNTALQHGKLSYSVLFILTVNDTNDVQRVLGTTSDAPLSVVIVGIGDGNFGSMGCPNESGKRNNAQFVRFNGQRDASGPREALLSEEVLERIQDQLLEYFG